MFQIKTDKLRLEERLALLNNLKNPTLSDDEYLRILDSCYCYSENITSRDMAEFFDLSIKDLSFNLLLTMETERGEQVAFLACTSRAFYENEFDFKHNYSLDEIRDLIKLHKIFVYRYLTGKTDTVLTDRLNNFARLDEVVATAHTFSDLGIYKDWLLPFIKKFFSKERITTDILMIIAVLKQDLEARKQEIMQNMEALNKELYVNTQLSDDLDTYLVSCMDALNKPSEGRK